jgi:anti-sigma regulatory factor (Ser/Thr protein kinase)
MARSVSQTFRCRAETVPRVRAVVAEELRRHGIEGELLDRLVLASAEACNNAILHSESSVYEVRIDVDPVCVTVTVRDQGAGFDVPADMAMPAPDAVSRRGLALMHVLVDDVAVTSNGTGTTVVLRQSLNGRSARPRPVGSAPVFS